MKKVAILAALTMITALFSFAVSAEEISEPGSTKLTVNASKGVAYTLSIPSGTVNVDIAKDGAQKIGDIGLSACAIDNGKEVKVAVTSANGHKLKNDTSSATYTLSKEVWKFTAKTDPLEAINLTITDRDSAILAGTYTDTLTFTATYEAIA